MATDSQIIKLAGSHGAQPGDEINSIKTHAYALQMNGSEEEKDAGSNDDLEDSQKHVADEDLNRKKKQTYSGWILIWLAYQSTGVIYGDIGTSPLYVYSSTFSSQPSYDDLVGALSIIIWSLTIMVTIKYVFIVLSADDDGEGGTFALYSLLARFANIVRKDPNTPGLMKLERVKTSDMKYGARGVRSFIENSATIRATLKVIGVIGVSMVMADGILTPAQSVLGAIQGIRVAQPDISGGAIVGISCAILIILFAIQPFGVSKLTLGFAPVVIIWLLFNFCSGIYNLTQFDYTVLRAFSPYFAGSFLVRNGEEGWRSLGGLLLAFTGVEALFADLGAFSKRAIQLSWLLLAYPCLLVAYVGQAAYISADATETAFSNPFFNTVPPGTLFFSLVIATLAAIVASQAMITSSFQLLSQVMAMSYFPHIKTVHTSTTFHGQVYIPFANWLLMIGTVIVTAVYSNTTNLGNAYGVCVIIVTFITTCMVSLVAIIVWRFNVVIVLFFFLVFGAFDGAYLSSALTKVPAGAWFTLVLSGIISTIFILWRFGKENQWSAEAEDRFQPSQLMTTNAAGETTLTPAFGSGEVRIIRGFGIMFDKVGDMVPIVFAQFIRKFAARPEIIIFFHMRPISVPSIPESERYVISRTSIPSCYRVTLRHGYTDQVVTPDLGRLLAEHLVLYITRENGVTSETSSATSKTHSPGVQAELNVLEQARLAQTVYVMGKEQMKIKRDTSIAKRILFEAFLWIRENSRAKMADMNIPTDNLVEVGFIKEI